MTHLLPHTILNAAARFPNREAFRCGKESLTFAQMAGKMNQLADLLRQLGIEKGDRVGIYLNRSLETAIAIYGIMRAGAAYVPIDPQLPAERARYLIANCGIRILVSHSTQKRRLENLIKEETSLEVIIGLTAEWALPCIPWENLNQQDSLFEPPFPILENDLAYIIFTSGSTGLPKGIMHSHYSGLSYAKLTASLYQLKETDRIGNHAPIYFDISTLGYFTAPLVGACTVIVPDAYTLMPASLSKLIADEKLTVWYSVPLAMVQMIEKGMLQERDCSSLRWVLYGGEPFPPKFLKRLMNQWPAARFSNVYGPAEVNQCTYYNLLNPPEDDQPIPIGQVWENTEMLIFDEQDDEVAVGQAGELLIRSATMMMGYWQNAELTNRSQYRRKMESGVEEVYYRTGDLVKQDEEGLLHFLGRKDHQIKIRGYRVELGAIEAALVNDPAVAEAAVFPVKREEEETLIVAAVILNGLIAVTEKDLLQGLKAKLPHYAIPATIKICDNFPRTGSGKINRSAIKAGVLKEK